MPAALFTAAASGFYEPHRVTDLPLPAPSYAGLIPVDALGSRLFYWLFLAHERSDDNEATPLVVWLNGGPGLSSMFGLFNENGPLEVDSQTLAMRPRKLHWNRRFTMLYIDSPAGVGYSRRGSGGSVRSAKHAATHLWVFLQRLVSMHSELKAAPLYLTGESFCGHYLPPLADHILSANAIARAASWNASTTRAIDATLLAALPEASDIVPLHLVGVSIGGMQADIRQRVRRWPEVAFAFGLLTRDQLVRGQSLASNFSTRLDTPGMPLSEAMAPKHELEEMVATASGVTKLNLARQHGTYCLYRFAHLLNTSVMTERVHADATRHEDAPPHEAHSQFVALSMGAQEALIADVHSRALEPSSELKHTRVLPPTLA